MAEHGPDLDGLLRSVVVTIGERLDLFSVDIWSFSHDADTLVCRGFWCRDEAAAKQRDCVGAAVGLDQSHDIRRLVLATETIERHLDDDLSPAASAALTQGGYSSRIDRPLVSGAEVVGVLSLAETRGIRRLSESERDELNALCRLAAAVLRTIGLYEAERDRGRQLEGLLEAGRGAAGVPQIREAAATARHRAPGLIGGVQCELDMLLLQDDGSYAVVGRDGAADAEAAGRRADALARQAVQLQRPEQVRMEDGRRRLVLPLVVSDKAFGFLDLRARLKRRFRPREIELAMMLAEQTAATISRARTYGQLASRSATDTLTSLFSRWYFYERLYAEVARAHRYRQPLALIVAELDTYEELADVKGPEVRDAVLTVMARLILRSLREKVDIPCRLGGGRFAILLPNTPGGAEAAVVVAERVRQTVDATRLVDDELGNLGRHTMSLGVAGYPADADDAEELATRAEAMLAKATMDGGNRVEPPLPEPDETGDGSELDETEAEGGASETADDDPDAGVGELEAGEGELEEIAGDGGWGVREPDPFWE